MTETAVLGGGCFWCVEAAFKELDGVEEAMPGYAGGESEDPSYRQVCSGGTGHAETVKVRYDPETVSYRELLEAFFSLHDPTQVNRQGPDTGEQYRSIILYKDQEQKRTAEKVIEDFRDEYDDRIATEVSELEKFYPAEEEHRDYFEKNPGDAYCLLHVQPKVEKARELM